VWTATLDAEVRSPVTYVDGAAYVGTTEGVVAVDPRDGSVRWVEDLGESVTGAPAVSDGRVFAVTAAGRLVGIGPPEDAGQAGRIDWEATLDGGSEAGPAVADGVVFVADSEGVIRAFGSDGERLWTRELTTPVTGGTAVTDSHVVVGTEAAEVVALDRDDGSIAWRAETRGPVRGTPAVAGDSDTTVYAADHDGTLSAFDAADGAVRFRHRVGRWLDAPPAVGHGAVFVADQTGRVYAVVGE
jgi:outer membrane protein assembly factor BamB